MRQVAWFIIGCTLVSCGFVATKDRHKRRKPHSSNGPKLIFVPEEERDRFDKIMEREQEDRFKDQVRLLKDRKHEIAWYPAARGDVKDHATAQVIYFDKTNYIIGYCSGGFASETRLTTAGHCHDSFSYLFKTGESCRGFVVFAYKEGPKSKTEYIQCDQLLVHTYQRTQTGDDGQKKFLDYSMFSLHGRGEASEARQPYSQLFSFLDSDAEQTKQALEGQKVIGLVVDPPSEYYNMQSRYDIVVGETIELERYSDIRALYFDHKNGTHVQSGNSGSPFYLIPGGEIPQAGDEITESELQYLSPLFGYLSGARSEGILTYPDNVALGFAEHL